MRQICCATHPHAKGNNNYTKDYSKNKELFYLMYQDAKNLYGWA